VNQAGREKAGFHQVVLEKDDEIGFPAAARER